MKQKKSTEFIVQLDVKSLAIVLSLACLSAIVIFYMGVIFGKADRDPNIDSRVDQTEIEKDSAAPNISIKDLKIFNIHDKKPQAKKISKPPVKAKAQAPPDKRVKATPGKKVKETPKKTAQPKDPSLFTIQVFSTVNKKKAEKFVNDLKKEGFDAYLSGFSIYGKDLHRVRVGKVSKSESLALKKKLKKSRILKTTEMEFRIFRFR